ncbi:hypothetical protein OE88DRAFT_1737369 [Heliocybe sulcata]|uniref:Uncharacterized protein n=1 Tax=Heliocybe sulcata TaxID=5364 RepID=A0A5C3MW47_9AGAM|nr:hypothetical protein OE88DRAFT_1737369 [Heliocybe sulcata]
MPHKRAKRSIREREKNQRGNDLAPREAGVSSEGIPKAMTRVLNAAKVQSDYRKRKNEDKDQANGGKKKRKVDGEAKLDRAEMQILPGESLAHFNRRVEDAMRPLVRSAVQTSSAQERKARKETLGKKTEKAEPNQNKNKRERDVDSDAVQGRAKPPPSKTEFATLSSSQPKRLNDIAQAPPQFAKTPKMRKAPEEKKSDGVVSMAQKRMMEEQRERAINRYRDMKQRKLRENGKLWTEETEQQEET